MTLPSITDPPSLKPIPSPSRVAKDVLVFFASTWAVVVIVVTPYLSRSSSDGEAVLFSNHPFWKDKQFLIIVVPTLPESDFAYKSQPSSELR